MKAIVHAGQSGLKGLKYKDIRDQKPGVGEVKVRIEAAGLNHRDLFIMADRTEQDVPLVIGSDGAGRIEAVGEGVFSHPLGADVIINPCIGWESADNVPYVPAIVGGPSDGTFAESIIIPAQNVISKPAYLSWEEAGVLPLSALTAYRALFTRGRLQQGEHVLIPGIGGGVATYAMKMASAVGARVSVTSRSETKRQAALINGADHAFDSHSDWRKVWMETPSISSSTASDLRRSHITLTLLNRVAVLSRLGQAREIEWRSRCGPYFSPN